MRLSGITSSLPKLQIPTTPESYRRESSQFDSSRLELNDSKCISEVGETCMKLYLNKRTYGICEKVTGVISLSFKSSSTANFIVLKITCREMLATYANNLEKNWNAESATSCKDRSATNSKLKLLSTMTTSYSTNTNHHKRRETEKRYKISVTEVKESESTPPGRENSVKEGSIKEKHVNVNILDQEERKRGEEEENKSDTSWYNDSFSAANAHANNTSKKCTMKDSTNLNLKPSFFSISGSSTVVPKDDFVLFEYLIPVFKFKKGKTPIGRFKFRFTFDVPRNFPVTHSFEAQDFSYELKYHLQAELVDHSEEGTTVVMSTEPRTMILNPFFEENQAPVEDILKEFSKQKRKALFCFKPSFYSSTVQADRTVLTAHDRINLSISVNESLFGSLHYVTIMLAEEARLSHPTETGKVFIDHRDLFLGEIAKTAFDTTTREIQNYQIKFPTVNMRSMATKDFDVKHKLVFVFKNKKDHTLLEDSIAIVVYNLGHHEPTHEEIIKKGQHAEEVMLAPTLKITDIEDFLVDSKCKTDQEKYRQILRPEPIEEENPSEKSGSSTDLFKQLESIIIKFFRQLLLDLCVVSQLLFCLLNTFMYYEQLNKCVYS
eukprot:TRINITY_DN11102_c0_g1_i3.p1 TRINITY_DN11102_c0_g1~~TRINITY_DN11102_c0_g1_i3.p1  ORF type:complete len:606 (+),score=70.12 TRINITY_DN11102_c0_g1_i3:167-1984(+)